MTAPGGSSPMRIGGAALLAAGVIAGIIGLATVIGEGDEGVSTAAPGTTGATSEPAAPPAPGEPGPGSGSVPVPSFGGEAPPGVTAPAPGAAGGAGGTGTGPGGTGSGGAGTGGTGSGGAGSGGTGSGGAGSGGTGSGGTGSGGTGSGGVGSGSAGSGGTSGGKGSAGGSGGTAGGSGGTRAPLAARMPLRVYNNSTIPGLAAEGERDFEAAGWTVTEVGNYSRGIIPTSTVYYRPGTAEQASAERLAAEFGLRANPRFEGIQDATPGLIVILTRDYQRR